MVQKGGRMHRVGRAGMITYYADQNKGLKGVCSGDGSEFSCDWDAYLASFAKSKDKNEQSIARNMLRVAEGKRSRALIS